MAELKAIICFLFALCMGTCSTLLSKIMYGIESVDSEGQVKFFQKPFMQTFLMFVAMIVALPLHFYMEYRQSAIEHRQNRIPLRSYFVLALPAISDLAATSLCMVGLLYVSVSTYQLLRCTVILFVALQKYFILKYELKSYMWAGVLCNALAIVLVSASAFADPGASNDASQVAFGIAILLIGCLIMSIQFVLEETVMAGDKATGSGQGIPPLVVVGTEGVWGTIIMICVVFPMAHALPGSDAGSLENVWDSIVMVQHNVELQAMVLVYIFTITAFNASAIFVTFLMDSVWRSILANFRPVAIWATDLALFYFVTNGAFGERWTPWSWVQLAGMMMLFFGTAVYNASIRLPGFEYNEKEVKLQVAITPSGQSVFNSPYITKRTSMLPMDKNGPEASPYGTFQRKISQPRKSFKSLHFPSDAHSAFELS